MDELADRLSPIERLMPDDVPLDPPPPPGMWVPDLRYPQDLYAAYESGPQVLSRASARAAEHDLVALDLPVGLDPEGFKAVVGDRLWRTPLLQGLLPLLRDPQRFGAVTRELSDQLGLTKQDAQATWQTLMRWLLAFCPERVERRVYRRSEVVVVRERGTP
jgi:hypothetical protein